MRFRNPLIVNGVLYGCDDDIIEMVRQRIPYAMEGFNEHSTALGVVKNGRILGGVVFDKYTGRDMIMSAAFDSPSWCTKETLRELFGYPFGQLGLTRLTTITSADNTKALRIDEGLGFKREGVLRKHYPGDVDAIVLGMLREECRWLQRK